MKFSKLSAVGVALLSASMAPAALAGFPSVIVGFGPGSMAVPTLGTSALIALGLLLAVIALRTFKGSSTGKAAAIALFSAGLISGGLGIERTMATSEFSVLGEGDCETGGSKNIGFPRSGNTFTNDCENPMSITGYSFADPQETCVLIPNNENQQAPACVVNSPIAPGGVCALPICQIEVSIIDN